MMKKSIMLGLSLITAFSIWGVPKVSAYDDSALVNKSSTSYGYAYLGKSSNGKNKQKLYNEMYNSAFDLWKSSEDVRLSDGYYMLGSFNLTKYGLSQEDGLAVLTTLKNDNPIFYFISNSSLVSTQMDEKGKTEKIGVLLYDEYADGDARKSAQDEIYDYITKAYTQMSGMDSVYDKTVYLHNLINDAVEYEKVGGVPSRRDDAHNIMGVIEDGSGVCESYARTFEAVLNYADVDNLLVLGTANGGNHAWNMVRLDDGKYYFFDTTWDDLLDTDMFLAAGSGTMSMYHKAATPSDVGLEFLYELPTASVTDYDPAAVAEPAPYETRYSLGDVNRDGEIDIEDAVLVIGYVNATASIRDTSLADVNYDDRIDIEDAARLINYVNGVSVL